MIAGAVAVTVASLALAGILAVENAMLKRELEQARRRELIDA